MKSYHFIDSHSMTAHQMTMPISLIPTLHLPCLQNHPPRNSSSHFSPPGIIFSPYYIVRPSNGISKLCTPKKPRRIPHILLRCGLFWRSVQGTLRQWYLTTCYD